MDSNFSFFIVICLMGVTFYYYTKFKDYEDRYRLNEREFYLLNKHVDKLTYENANYKVRIKDLQKYKNDVSKTFKILDNELVHINNHVEKNSQINRRNLEQSEHISLLTPDLLTNLIENMNQDFSIFNNEYLSNNNSTELDTPKTETPVEKPAGTPVEKPVETPAGTPAGTPVETPVGTSAGTSLISNETETNSTDKVTDSIQIKNDNKNEHLLRSMSFPNLPNVYQRLMIPRIQISPIDEQLSSNIENVIVNKI